MESAVELTVLAAQEAVLQFTSFNADAAWRLGTDLRVLAAAQAKPVAIGIWLSGQTLFYSGTNGIMPGNEEWLRRKRNTVLRFGRSTLRIATELALAGTSLEAKQGLPLADFAAHGGGFPLLLSGTGCIGAIVVSGLTQRNDHALVVQALSVLLQKEVEQLA